MYESVGGHGQRRRSGRHPHHRWCILWLCDLICSGPVVKARLSTDLRSRVPCAPSAARRLWRASRRRRPGCGIRHKTTLAMQVPGRPRQSNMQAGLSKSAPVGGQVRSGRLSLLAAITSTSTSPNSLRAGSPWLVVIAARSHRWTWDASCH